MCSVLFVCGLRARVRKSYPTCRSSGHGTGMEASQNSQKFQVQQSSLLSKTPIVSQLPALTTTFFPDAGCRPADTHHASSFTPRGSPQLLHIRPFNFNFSTSCQGGVIVRFTVFRFRPINSGLAATACLKTHVTRSLTPCMVTVRVKHGSPLSYASLKGERHRAGTTTLYLFVAQAYRTHRSSGYGIERLYPYVPRVLWRRCVPVQNSQKIQVRV